MPDTHTDMERRLRAAARTLREAKAKRNAVVVEAYSRGLSLRKIAGLVELSHSGVERITRAESGLADDKS